MTADDFMRGIEGGSASGMDCGCIGMEDFFSLSRSHDPQLHLDRAVSSLQSQFELLSGDNSRLDYLHNESAVSLEARVACLKDWHDKLNALASQLLMAGAPFRYALVADLRSLTTRGSSVVVSATVDGLKVDSVEVLSGAMYECASDAKMLKSRCGRGRVARVSHIFLMMAVDPLVFMDVCNSCASPRLGELWARGRQMRSLSSGCFKMRLCCRNLVEALARS